jgi:hypothetical protein
MKQYLIDAVTNNVKDGIMILWLERLSSNIIF